MVVKQGQLCGRPQVLSDLCRRAHSDASKVVQRFMISYGKQIV